MRLRYTEPDLERPFRVPGTCGSAALPVAALLGIPLTAAFGCRSPTHNAAASAGRPGCARRRALRLARASAAARG